MQRERHNDPVAAEFSGTSNRARPRHRCRTKAFARGHVKLYRQGDTKPWREIKDVHSPFTMLVALGSLWVGYQGTFADALARYRLRSTDRTWFQHVANYLPLGLAVNPQASLVAAKSRRVSKTTVQIVDVASGKRKQIYEGGVQAMTADDSGNLFTAEHYFDTDATNWALAVSPLDGTLYVACIGKSSVQIYDPQTRSRLMYIPIPCW